MVDYAFMRHWHVIDYGPEWSCTKAACLLQVRVQLPCLESLSGIKCACQLKEYSVSSLVLFVNQ